MCASRHCQSGAVGSVGVGWDGFGRDGTGGSGGAWPQGAVAPFAHPDSSVGLNLHELGDDTTRYYYGELIQARQSTGIPGYH